MLRKTDSNNPTDWIYIAQSDLEGLKMLGEKELSFLMCRSKLAEVLEKVMKAELLRQGWFLEKIHDLEKLLGELSARDSDLWNDLSPLCVRLSEAYMVDRYPGFDIDDPDWPELRRQISKVEKLLLNVKSRL